MKIRFWMALLAVIGVTGTSAADQSFLAPETWTQQTTPSKGWTSEHPHLLADVTGDGRQDLVGFGPDGVWVGRSTGASFATVLRLADFGYHSGWRRSRHVRTAGDIDGDGDADVVGFGNRGVFRALSVGGGALGPATFVIENFGYDQGWRVDEHERMLADVNGDGKDDVVAFGYHGVWLALASGDGFFSAPFFALAEFGTQQGWTPAKHIRTTGDIDGDGCDDIVAFGDHGVWIALGAPTGVGPAQFVINDFGYLAGAWSLNHPRVLADVDDDGRKDIVAFGTAGVWVAYANGFAFDPPVYALADFGTQQGYVSTSGRHVGDFNGDGYADIVASGERAVRRSLGTPTGFERGRNVLRDFTVAGHFNTGPPARFAGDVDGNGTTDLVSVATSNVRVARSTDQPPPRPPSPPVDERITAFTSSSVTVEWGHSGGDFVGFVITYTKDGGPERSTTAGRDLRKRTVTGLEPDTRYCFRIWAQSVFDISPIAFVGCQRTDPEEAPPPPPPPPSGFSALDVYNCYSAERPLHIWTLDLTTNTWVERGTVESMWVDNSCPGVQPPLNFALADGHTFRVVAVDPQQSLCRVNDPTLVNCQVSILTFIRGHAAGPVARMNIGF